MTYGPIDFLVVEFPDNAKLRGDALAAIIELVEDEIIRIIDLLIVMKDADGNITSRELRELEPQWIALLDPLKATVTGLVSVNDVNEIAGALENNSTAALLVYENLWAIKTMEALLAADARVILQERIPHEIVVEELADIAVIAAQEG